MSNFRVGQMVGNGRRHARWFTRAIAVLAAATGLPAFAQSCPNNGRTLTADVVAFDQPIMYNRLGASNVNGMMFALKRDVVGEKAVPDQPTLKDVPLTMGGAATPGKVSLRPDKRPRPLVLRVAAGDCLKVTVTNLLTPNPNPFEVAPNQQNPGPDPTNGRVVPPNVTTGFNVFIDEQVKDRVVGFHVSGMQVVDSIDSDSSFVGKNGNSLAPQGAGIGGAKTYWLYAEKEGVFLIQSQGSTIGADANQGNAGNGLFGQVIVEPKGARIYRSLALEEEMRLVTRTGTASEAGTCPKLGNKVSPTSLSSYCLTPSGQPVINYEATYPTDPTTPTIWDREGKGGLPVLNMITASNEIVHSELEAMIVGPNTDGTFPPTTYPLESKGYRNPTVPNRLEPFRDFAQVWHDEPSTAQAFPGFYNDPVFRYVLAGVKDGFMINYGSGGIGSEIIANRLGVGPMYDCLSCAYEEFFLTSFTVGDPAVLVDIPANTGLENCAPDLADCAAKGPKATKALYPGDPSNVHHSYIGDFVKFRNTHIGKEQHVFHLHNHQWLYNPNDDNANYLDAQGLGPGVGYTYEINFGGSGNRNKSAGDAIFHCHFYPHFAQGMWYHWRHYDVFEEGSKLLASNGPDGFHTMPWALQNGTPAPGARAHPDGEMAAGVPIVGIVPLPGKGMAPMPADVTVVANAKGAGSLAQINRASMLGPDGIAGTADDKNPGYPFWIAGIENVVGQRPPTPVLDMLNAAQAAEIAKDKVCTNTTTGAKTLRRADNCEAGETNESYGLWSGIVADQADGHDGGLPRSALLGYFDGGATEHNVVSPRDFTKVIAKAKPVYFPEEGTDAEKVAMKFHATRLHSTFKNQLAGGAADSFFAVNGAPPAIGAPYHEPCIDDTGRRLGASVVGHFFSGEQGSDAASVGALLATPGFEGTGMKTKGSSFFNADNPRRYKGANIQFDAILNKVGYHYPQQRIIALWQDVVPVISKQQPPEPLVMRLNTFDCAVYSHTNLVPEYFEMDDYQVRTPTDIIGQHIHLPKWDLTTTDGAANGWNYEDGTLSPGAIRERIHAINEWNIEQACDGHATVAPPQGATVEDHTCTAGTMVNQVVQVPILHAKSHPFFGPTGPGGANWLGARTTMQRWFADPVVNTEGMDRGLGIIFTHDHYGPSTHQQIGLYATVLAQPAGSTWMHNEKELQLGVGPDGKGGRMDGGPTSWQARIIPPSKEIAGNTTQSHRVGDFREFYFEFSDFQHAYEAGVYVGADGFGVPIPPVPGFPDSGFDLNDPDIFITQNDRINRVIGTDLANSFRVAINPPARFQVAPVYPDLVIEAVNCVVDPANPATVLLSRPCPQAIDVQDPGMHVNNYRNEPIALRVFDPGKIGPDGKPGMQADGLAGDLAFALASKIVNKDGTTAPITRVIDALNKAEADLMPWGAANALNQASAVEPGDPFTPMIRAYQGDTIRVKIQAGGHEEEHNASISGMKWLQGGSGFGKQPNSGWRSSQAAGISEQFTLAIPLVAPGDSPSGGGKLIQRDYLYNIDSSMDGWWSGTWGLVRTYENIRNDLRPLPSNKTPKPDRLLNRQEFVGVCPVGAPARNIGVVAILANELLADRVQGMNLSITPTGKSLDPDSPTARAANQLHVGAPLTGTGSLVYNPRTTKVGGKDAGEDAPQLAALWHEGPIHDPTAMLYVRLDDLVPVNSRTGACKDSPGLPGVANADCPVKLKDGFKPEPLVLRGNAGECVNLTLYNRLPPVAPDLPTLATIQGLNKRTRNDPQGSIPFDNNLIRPSSYVGISPQLVAIDPYVALGVNVGTNITQTVPPVTVEVVKGKEKRKTSYSTFKWYLGDLSFPQNPDGTVSSVALPVEFGGFGLSPADKIKQGQKSLVGGMVVVPQGATIAEDVTAPANKTRAQATITNTDGTKFRDFMLVMSKNLNHRYKDGAAVEHMNGEGVGIPEDSQENSAMAFNYGIEPLWFRFGVLPQAPFGGAGCGPGCYGGMPNQHMAYSNELAKTGTDTVGDPATPVFKAKAGDEVRIHSAVPHGTSRGTTLGFHGHVWQRDPYVCPNEARNELTGACNMIGVGSKAIGDNPMGFAQGAQESVTPYSHFTFRFPKAGGANSVVGDYLFKDYGSFGNASGLWGILRVE